MTPHCSQCGKENAVDSPFCVHCRARLGQGRDHPTSCRGCHMAHDVWRANALCDRCMEEQAQHDDEIGQRWADHFAECRDDLDDMRPLDVLELG